MTNKHCLVYETLGTVSDLKISEANGDGLTRLEGVFGVCGIKNQNNRIYDKENYKQMVESLQKVIKTQGCPGELEHPNSMNINLENVSHKIESIQMNEDGTITGTICLLNTPKGQIAKAIVEGGLPLYISSRGAGTITNEGKVTLSSIKTYDLVGTPGFSQAKLNLKANQTLECLNESLDDENQIWAIVESDDLLSGVDDGGDSSGDDAADDSKDSKKENDSSEKEEDKKEKKEKDKEEPKKEPKKEENDKEDNKNKNEDINMKDLKEAIDKLSDKVTSLEAELHIAKESLDETKSSIRPTNYGAIEQWITEEFEVNFKNSLMEDITDMVNDTVDMKVNEATESISTGVENWVTEEFAPNVQNWVTEEFAPEVQKWVTEEFAPEVQNWVTEEFAPEIQNWITEEYSPEVQNWVTEEFAPVVDSWVTEEYGSTIKSEINENVSSFLAESRAGRLDEIDSLLETISTNNTPLENIVKENEESNKYKGIYVVENMPSQYRPSWEMLDENRKNEILRTSKMYDFTKEGVLESFWANVEFEKKQVNEKVDDSPIKSYHNNIFSQMMRLRK